MSKTTNEYSSKYKKEEKEAKINEYLDGLLRDLDALEKYAPYHTTLAKERQSKTKVLHNKDLTNQIFDFIHTPNNNKLFDISKSKEEQMEIKEKHRYDSLKRMFEYKPDWLIQLIKNPQSTIDITDNVSEEEKEREYERQYRILGYYKEFKELEYKYSKESQALKSKIKEENRQMDLLTNVSKYLENKSKTIKSKSKTKTKGGTRKHKKSKTNKQK